MKRYLLALSAVIIAVTGTQAQEMMTLEQAIETALLQNPQIITARNGAVIARNSAALGRADLFPRLTLGGGADYLDSELSGASAAASAAASVTYTVFDGLGNFYRMKTAASAGRQGFLSARYQIEMTVFQVSQAYYRAASAREALTIAREALRISRERMQRAAQRSAYGRAGAVDVLSARVDVNTDSVAAVNAALAWGQSRRNLNLLLNREIERSFQVDTLVSYRPLPGLEDLVTAAGEQNAVLLIAGERAAQAQYSAGAAAGALWPRVELSGSAGYSQSGAAPGAGFDNMSGTVRGGVNISWTLFNGSRLRLARDNARIDAENQKLLLSYAARSLETDIINAWEAYKNSRMVLDLEIENLEAAKLNFQRNRDLYRLGQVTATQFREAQLNLSRSRTRLQTSKYTAKINELTILQLSGRLVTAEAL